jgi:hypothetical protein
MAIWYICWLIGIYFPVLVSITEKNLATLLHSLHQARRPQLANSRGLRFFQASHNAAHVCCGAARVFVLLHHDVVIGVLKRQRLHLIITCNL